MCHNVCVFTYFQENSEYMLYLRQSQQEILKEEQRRYRFLAEKHCGLTQSLLFLINKVTLQSEETQAKRNEGFDELWVEHLSIILVIWSQAVMVQTFVY